ncbi:N-acetylmuramoyl-L-alanine amidase [Alkalicoccus urumqiensis]|uniref:N-acetylmuramoyl-L-alanine amidase n=1 Tax=Alkalicoccus urumqiensis TaxID=1548213 RepID=A0A2P6MI56_ALKUR|nr:N-acetylmuramoyl-L-alanine amidase [Alkalicoccus urumqiensis]PRO65950.1 hypothetical protein C6I21_06500 [Alkalicoccus urumqiensis]
MKWIGTLSVVSLAAAAFAGGSAASASTFSDTDETEVDVLAEEGIVSGYEGNEFRPDRSVTRAEAAVMIGRANDFQNDDTSTPFADVPDSHYAAAHIQAAVENDVLNGYPDGTFQPDETLSRGEMAAVLNRSFDMDTEQDISFTDIQPGHTFYGDIYELAESGVTSGYPDGTFRSDQSISRLEFSLMLTRTMYPEFRPEADGPGPDYEPDTEGVNTDDAIGVGEVVNSPTLNVRTGPSTNNEQIGRLAEGEEVAVHERVDNWVRISTDSVDGYVSHAYLMVDYFDHESPLLGETIVVDPGHGGGDPGGLGNGLSESPIVLDVSLYLEPMLQEAGANVIMTRRSDWYPELSERVQQANNAEADVFLSVHTNAAGSSAARGTETFYDDTYAPGDSSRLAEDLQREMLAKLGTNDRGVKEYGFYVIRNAQMPSALVELAFKTNDADAEKLRTDEFRRDSAEALYDGLVEYYD